VSVREILDREARWARPAAFAAILAVALYLGSILIEQAADLVDRENDATRLATFHEHSGGLLATAIMFAIGVALLSIPLFYVFKAIEARIERPQRALVAFAFIGPLLFAAQSILAWVANTDVADDFVDHVGSRTGDDATNFAEDLIDDSTLAQVAGALPLPALLGLVVALVYVGWQGMRTGLLTRFWGSLGMAFGVSMALIPPLALLGALVWFVYLGLLFAGWIPGGRPPAWAAGEAIPWPKPGEQPVEGSGRELSEPELPDESSTGETQGQPRKKRKRRD
jgi:hypothetical protein